MLPYACDDGGCSGWEWVAIQTVCAATLVLFWPVVLLARLSEALATPRGSGGAF